MRRFTYTEYPWAVKESKDPDKLRGDADGLETAEVHLESFCLNMSAWMQVLRAHGDYYTLRGEFNLAKECYDGGMHSLIIPPEPPIDTVITAIAGEDDTVTLDELTTFLTVRGAENPTAQAVMSCPVKPLLELSPCTQAALMGGTNSFGREEFKQLCKDHFDDSEDDLGPYPKAVDLGVMTRLGQANTRHKVP